MSEQEKKTNSGQFQQGNTVGKKTRFKKNNGAAVKYKDEFCDLMEQFFREQDCKVITKRNTSKTEHLKRKSLK